MAGNTEELERSWQKGPEYVDVAVVAKLVRARLKAEFPGQKFRVRTSRYSMGASVDLSWVDGPSADRVRAVTSAYEGAGFDGMIDLKYSYESWLLPDGSAVHAHSRGTEGSMGTVSGFEESRPHPDARLVHFGADFVTPQRAASDEAKARIEAWDARHFEAGPAYPEWQRFWRVFQRVSFTPDGLMHVEKEGYR